MAIKNEDIFKNVVAHAKEYGFVFPSSEIYDGLSAVYDYGQYGSELKNNIKTYWWKAMVQMNENIVGIDSAIFMHPKIWKASGHVDGFSDPMIDNKDSKKRYRADQLLEDKIEQLCEPRIKLAKSLGYYYEIESGSFNGVETGFVVEGGNMINKFQIRENFLLQDPNYVEGINLSLESLEVLKNNDLSGMKDLIIKYKIVCPVSGTANWTDVRQFNLMFSTQMGAMAEDSDQVYLRPETAQGIFVNFLNVQKSGRMKIPFGIAQIGKAFRNEVIARQFIMRMREFEQMEMQFFVKPGEEMTWRLQATRPGR